jgi:hypothetical protein
MGDRVEASGLVVGHNHEVQRRLRRCVAALRRMVDGGWFVAHEDTIGMEVELDLVDPLGRPRPVNDAVLARLGRADMQHELGQFNVELNIAPPQAMRSSPANASRSFGRAAAVFDLITGNWRCARPNRTFRCYQKPVVSRRPQP